MAFVPEYQVTALRLSGEFSAFPASPASFSPAELAPAEELMCRRSSLTSTMQWFVQFVGNSFKAFAVPEDTLIRISCLVLSKSLHSTHRCINKYEPVIPIRLSRSQPANVVIRAV
jgi:hypothetical protein